MSVKKYLSVFMTVLAMVWAGAWVAAWAGVGHAGASESRTTLTLMTHDSFSIGKKVIRAFEEKNAVTLKFLKAGDAGAALNRAILSKNNPMADLFFGVDNAFLSRAIQADMFEPYHSPLLGDIPERFKLDKTGRLTPIDFGDVCLNYDKKWFADKKIPPPSSMEDLTDPAYKGLLVVENPAVSSPGLAFLLATISRFGESGHLDFWRKLKKNDALVVNGWNEAYWGKFTAASRGDRPIVVSYATSPAAEVFFSKEKIDAPPTAAITGAGECYRQIEFAGIFKGSKNRDAAKKFMDFMLSPAFQEDIPLNMFVFPVNPNARLPEVFAAHAKTAEKPGAVSHEKIAEKRMEWIDAWTTEMLR